MLTPQEDHYLKNQLLADQLESEFQKSWDDHTKFLPNLGYPFVPAERLLATHQNDYPILKFVFLEFIKRFPYFRDVDTKMGLDPIDSIPPDSTNNNAFFRTKIMPFFNYILSKNLSSSADRQELSKRRKASLKILKTLQLFVSSCLTTTQEELYYSAGMSTGVERDLNVSAAIEQQIRQIEDISEDEIKTQLSPGYVNGYLVEIIGVRTTDHESQGAGIFGFSKAATTVTKSYEFIISVKFEIVDNGGTNDGPIVQEFLVFRLYQSFKELLVKLKKSFPNLTLPKVPPKYKHATLYTPGEVVSDIPDFDSVLGDETDSQSILDYILTKNGSKKSHSSSPSVVKSPAALKLGLRKLNIRLPTPQEKTPVIDTGEFSARSLPREKLRILLNHYMQALLSIEEICECIHFKEFLFRDSKLFLALSDEDKEDIDMRVKIGCMNIKNQLIFQKKIYLHNLRFKNELNVFKDLIFHADNSRYLHEKYTTETLFKYRSYLTGEESVAKLILGEFKNSSRLRDMSPILQTVIKWFKLRFASFLYDLFFNTKGSPNEPVSYELFSQIKRIHLLFPYTILQQTLKVTNPLSMAKRLLEFFLYQPPTLTKLWSSDGTPHRSLIQVLLNSVITSDITDLDNKIALAKAKLVFPGAPRLVARMEEVIQLPEEKRTAIIGDDPVLACLSSSVHQRIRDYIIELKNDGDKDGLYEKLRELFQLLLRKHDKEIISQLWSESYLNNFIKDFLVIFFEPLISIFSKNALFKKCVKMMQSFVSDMLLLVEYLFDYVYLLSANEIILSLYLMVSKYEDFVLEFLHESYANDKEHFFDNLVDWVDGILNIMKYFKNGSSDSKLNMEDIINSVKVDETVLKKELSEIIKSKKETILKSQVQSSSLKEDNLVNKNWEILEKMQLFDPQDLGVFGKDDYEEFSKEIENLTENNDEDEDTKKCHHPEIGKLSEVFKERLMVLFESACEALT